MKATKKEDYSEELQFVTDFYGDGLDQHQLNMQHGVPTSNIPSESAQDLSSVINYLKIFLKLRRHLYQKYLPLHHWY